MTKTLLKDKLEKLEMEWQSIETAPKDGEMVLIAHNTLRGGALIRESWLEDGVWYFMSGQGLTPLTGEYRPTHWMPLPPPPIDK